MSDLLACVVSGLCGFTVGLSELLNRYKTFKAVFSNSYSWIYMGINFTASVLVFWLLVIYNVPLGPLKAHKIGVSLAAGFGAMAFLRSSFFNYKDSNDKLIEVGPAAILSVFLRAAERQFSQTLSRTNVTDIARIMKGLPFLSSSKELPLIILTSLRIFSPDEQKNLSEEILALVNDAGTNEEVKNIALGTILERYAGKEFLSTAVDSLREIYERQKEQRLKIENMQKMLESLKTP